MKSLKIKLQGKKGNYLPITITLNDEVDQFGNQGPDSVIKLKKNVKLKLLKLI